MRPETFERLVLAFEELGGRQLDVTGGDPLVHPRIGELLDRLTSRQLHRALCTNGLLLHRVESQLRRGCVDEVKMSVHASTDTVGKELLGAPWSADRVNQAIQLAMDSGVRVTMNFSVTSSNLAEFDSVLMKSIKFGTDLLLIDLISTKWDVDQSPLNGASNSPAVARIVELGSYEGVVADRTGCQLLTFTGPSGQRWMVKDVRNGLLFTGMCQGCTVKDRCGEGVFVLRVDSQGNLRPCLLREDLTEREDLDHLSVEELKSMLADQAARMMVHPFEVSAGSTIYVDRPELDR
jgi:molybdenum cofactor biosynthesis enzyme MoaA